MGVYREALESKVADSPLLQAIFLSNICACEQALERYVDALSSASIAISLAPTFAKARSRLATLYGELDMHKEAIEAYDSLLELPLDNEERNVANWNKREVEKKKAAQPNWYKLLGLKDFGSATTTSDVKKAYKKLALVHHPDKNSLLLAPSCLNSSRKLRGCCATIPSAKNGGENSARKRQRRVIRAGERRALLLLLNLLPQTLVPLTLALIRGSRENMPKM